MTLRYSLLLIRDKRILAALNIILRIFFFTNTITFLRAVTRGKTGKIAIMHGFYGIERSSSNVCSAEKLTKQSTVLLLRLVSFPAEQMLAAACQRCGRCVSIVCWPDTCVNIYVQNSFKSYSLMQRHYLKKVRPNRPPRLKTNQNTDHRISTYWPAPAICLIET